MVGGDTYHVDFLYSACTQPVGQRGAVFLGAFEAALGGAVRALEEDGVDLAAGAGGGEVGVELAAFASDYTVDGEAVLEVRVFGEVAAWIDVMIPGSHDVLVVASLTVSTRSAMAEVNRAPPATGTLPPSQQSFCTSTMIKPRLITNTFQDGGTGEKPFETRRAGAPLRGESVCVRLVEQVPQP